MSGFTKVPGKSFKVIVKDPAEILDYKEDFAAWLAKTPTGAADTITGAPTWTVPVDLTVVAQSNTTLDATIKLSGGVLGAEYELACAIDTAAGRRAKRRFLVEMVAR